MSNTSREFLTENPGIRKIFDKTIRISLTIPIKNAIIYLYSAAVNLIYLKRGLTVITDTTEGGDIKLTPRIITKPSGPPYRAPNGRWFTDGLFWERNERLDHCLPVFSLHRDRKDYSNPTGLLVNCRRTFLALKDPTGYAWAMTYLADYAHWKTLCGLTWFKDALDLWKEELDLLLQSEALKKIEETARGDTQSAYQAAKYLANLEHRRTSSGRGRPSKAEVAGELKRQTEAAALINDDYNRVFAAPSTLETN